MHYDTPEEIFRTFSFGKIAYHGARRVNAVTIEVSLRKRSKSEGMTVDGEPIRNFLTLSICGNIWNARRSDIFSGGQNLGEIAKYAGGLDDPKLFRRLYQLWLRWHLNDMAAGTREQTAALEEAHASAVKAMEADGYVFERSFGRKDYGRLRQEDGTVKWGGLHYWTWAGFKGHYDWACEALKRRNLYTVEYGPELPDANGGMARRTYTYGHKWLVDPMPADVLEEVYSLFRMGAPEFGQRLDSWLASEAA